MKLQGEAVGLTSVSQGVYYCLVTVFFSSEGNDMSTKFLGLPIIKTLVHVNSRLASLHLHRASLLQVKLNFTPFVDARSVYNFHAKTTEKSTTTRFAKFQRRCS